MRKRSHPPQSGDSKVVKKPNNNNAPRGSSSRSNGPEAANDSVEARGPSIRSNGPEADNESVEAGPSSPRDAVDAPPLVDEPTRATYTAEQKILLMHLEKIFHKSRTKKNDIERVYLAKYAFYKKGRRISLYKDEKKATTWAYFHSELRNWVLDETYWKTYITERMTSDIREDLHSLNIDLSEAIQCRLSLMRNKLMNTDSHANAITKMIWREYTKPKLEERGLVFNRNPKLLPFKNQLIDFTSGRAVYRDVQQQDYILRPIPYDMLVVSATDPIYVKTLNILRQVIPNDDVRKFVLRTLYFALAGIPIDRYFVCQGAGGCGKGVLSLLLAKALRAEKMTNWNVQLLMTAINTKNPQPEFLKAEEKRVIVVNEIKAGQKLNLTTVKVLTGGDEFNARALRQDDRPIESLAQLWHFLNQEPVIEDIDNGIWRRVIKIPFSSRFVDNAAEVDEMKHIYQKNYQLKQEIKDKQDDYGRVFVRMIIDEFDELCKETESVPEYQNIPVPSIISEATKNYRRKENVFLGFLTENYENHPRCFTERRDLWAKFQQYAPTVAKKTSLKHFNNCMMLYLDPEKMRLGAQPKVDVYNNAVHEDLGLFGRVEYKNSHYVIGDAEQRGFLNLRLKT
nr:TPA_asm: S3H [Powellomyces chytrid fungus MELD virus 5]